MTYDLMKNKIAKKMYTTKEEVKEMLDVFLMFSRITKDQYIELSAMLNAQ